jgi:hypothetical protein
LFVRQNPQSLSIVSVSYTEAHFYITYCFLKLHLINVKTF